MLFRIRDRVQVFIVAPHARVCVCDSRLTTSSRGCSRRSGREEWGGSRVSRVRWKKTYVVSLYVALSRPLMTSLRSKIFGVRRIEYHGSLSWNVNLLNQRARSRFKACFRLSSAIDVNSAKLPPRLLSKRFSRRLLEWSDDEWSSRYLFVRIIVHRACRKWNKTVERSLKSVISRRNRD